MEIRNHKPAAVPPNKSNPFGEPWAFFGITLVWSYFFWGLAVFTKSAADSFLGNLCVILGGAGPFLAAAALTLLDRSPDRRRDFWRRIIDLRRIPAAMFAVILLTAPLTLSLAYLTQSVITSSVPDLQLGNDQIPTLLGFLSFVVGTLLFGPLPEEIGWRGFALDKLQSRWNSLTASLILAAIWAAWHIPLFLIQGTYQHQIGFGSTGFWLFLAALFPETILITWLYNRTNRSTLAAVLFHFMTNFTGQLLETPEGIDFYQFLWTTAIALAVLGFTGKNLSTKNKAQIKYC